MENNKYSKKYTDMNIAKALLKNEKTKPKTSKINRK